MEYMADVISLAKHGDLLGLTQALLADPALARACDAKGVSALMWAVYYGHPETAKLLAEAKGTVDLFEAAALGDLEAVQGLVSPDSVKQESPDGFTALGLAAYFGHIAVVNLLIEAGSELNRASNNPIGAAPLHSALANGHISVAKRLVEAGASPNVIAAGGWTVLHYCADLGDVDLTAFMIAHGATHGPRTEDGHTAFEHALEVNHTNVADYLREHAGA